MLARQDRQSVEFGGLGTDLCQQVLNAGQSVVVGVGHYRRRIAAFARRALSQIDTVCYQVLIIEDAASSRRSNRRGTNAEERPSIQRSGRGTSRCGSSRLKDLVNKRHRD
jgi:hypothetical protein